MMQDTRLWRVARAYLRDMVDRNLSKEYVRESERMLWAFKDYCLGKGVKSVQKIRADVLNGFLQKFERKSQAYQRLVYAILRGFLSFAECPVILKFRYRPRGRGRSVSWLTLEETEKVLTSKMRPREALLVVGGLLAGLRRCEVRAMTIGDLRMALKTNWLSIRGKCGPRQIPLHSDLAFVVKGFLQTVDAHDGDLAIPISKTRYLDIVQVVSKRLGIPFTSHALRRTFARNLRKLGVRIEVISRLLGHTNILTTERYIGVMQDDLEEAINLLKMRPSVQLMISPA